MRYSEIKTMDGLESAQKDVRERLRRRELAVRESLLLFSALFRDFSENRPYSCVRG